MSSVYFTLHMRNERLLVLFHTEHGNKGKKEGDAGVIRRGRRR